MFPFWRLGWPTGVYPYGLTQATKSLHRLLALLFGSSNYWPPLVCPVDAVMGHWARLDQPGWYHSSSHADIKKRLVTIRSHSEVNTYSMFPLVSVAHEQHFHSIFVQNGQNRRICGHKHSGMGDGNHLKNCQKTTFWPKFVFLIIFMQIFGWFIDLIFKDRIVDNQTIGIFWKFFRSKNADQKIDFGN